MMNDTSRFALRLCCRTLLCGLAIPGIGYSHAYAQADVRIFMDSTAQVIRGFGAANIVGWRPDMTDDEIETAFGVDEGQLGFSLLRLRIPPQKSQWSINVPTAQKAQAMGVEIIASPWSPPASMKTNGNLVGGELRREMYDDYAAHLDAFNTYMNDNGVAVFAVSVQNEPDIQVTYESCDWTPGDMRKFVKENAASIGTRIIAPESFQFRRAMSDPLLLDQAAAQNLDIVGGHIYGGGLAPYALAEEKGKEVWMTEHLVLETDLEANIGTGVEIQNVMKAGMSAYIWWYIVRFYGPISDGESGDFEKGEVTKRGYVMSQFSKFIRPGYVRIHTEGPAGLSGVSVTAYRDTSRVVVVAVNDAASPRELSFALESGSAGAFRRYVTSATQNVDNLDDVEAVDDRYTISLGANSVTTFVSDYTAVSSDADVAAPLPSYRLLSNYPNPFSISTTIGYTIPRAGDVTLGVFDLMGRSVATLVDGWRSAGSHQSAFDASPLAAGVYMYRLETEDDVQTRRMVVIK